MISSWAKARKAKARKGAKGSEHATSRSGRALGSDRNTLHQPPADRQGPRTPRNRNATLFATSATEAGSHPSQSADNQQPRRLSEGGREKRKAQALPLAPHMYSVCDRVRHEVPCPMAAWRLRHVPSAARGGTWRLGRVPSAARVLETCRLNLACVCSPPGPPAPLANSAPLSTAPRRDLRDLRDPRRSFGGCGPWREGGAGRVHRTRRPVAVGGKHCALVI